MKNRIINFIKYQKHIYSVYYVAMNLLINLISIFIKQNKKLIMFNSFAGRNFDDSPRAIYELMKEDKRFDDYKLVWTFHNPKKYDLDNVKIIKSDTIKYFITTLRARVWITNSSFERGLNYKKKNILYINTWHGTPIKKMGSDIDSNNQSFGTKSRKESSVDYMNSQSKYETEIFSRSFNIPENRFLNVGLPRNDILANYTKEDINIIKNKLGIPGDKTILLYCPTFREYERNVKDGGCILKPPIDLNKWADKLSKKYVLLFRAHYECVKSIDVEYNKFVIDVTKYPVLNELIIVSDILLSDYSSVYFDYSITGKPMLYFTYDYDEYNKNRGMYFDIRKYINGGDKEDEVIDILDNIDIDNEKKKTIAFRNEFVNYYGNATKATVDKIYEELRKDIK